MLQRSALALILVALLATFTVNAQEETDRKERTKREGRDGRQRMSREERRARFQKMMELRKDPAKMNEFLAKRQQEQLKKKVDVSEDEWTVIEPLLQAVITLKNNKTMLGRALDPRMDRWMRGRNREEAPAEGEEQEDPNNAIPGYKEGKALKDLLKGEDATAADIKEKLAAYRKVMEEQAKLLKEAQEKLREVLTSKQEALLVMESILN